MSSINTKEKKVDFSGLFWTLSTSFLAKKKKKQEKKRGWDPLGGSEFGGRSFLHFSSASFFGR